MTLFLNPFPSDALALIQKGEVFQKTGPVSVEYVATAQWIDTILANGLKETGRLVPADSYVITNPTGERYAISRNGFLQRYELKDGRWFAKGKIKAVRNPWNVAITIIPSWGELQHGEADCWLAVSLDELDTPYIIAADAFDATYLQVR